jgi:single-strand DNA-binding protein
MDSAVTLAGNLTQDPELRYTQSGQAVLTLRLAVNRRRMDKATSEWVDEVAFVDAVCWGDIAENVADSLDRGHRVLVVGRLQQQEWTDAEGTKRSKLQVVVDEIGPSLRWATAQVTRSVAETVHGGPARQAAPRATTPAPAMAATAPEDEEPF